MMAPLGYVDHGTIVVCECCMLAHANGECCAEEHPGKGDWHELPRSDGWDYAMGVEEHSEFCTPEDREEGCDCGRQEFAWSSCGACGDSNAGTRYTFVLWKKAEITVKSWVTAHVDNQ